MSGEARYYQASTEKKRRVLSVLFIGLMVSSDKRVSLNSPQLKEAYQRLASLMSEHGREW